MTDKSAVLPLEQFRNGDELSRRQAKIDRLREILNFLEAHPYMPLPYDVEFFTGNSYVGHLEAEEQAEILRNLGSFTKRYDDDRFIAVKEIIPGIEISIYFSREKVCRRVVVGKKQIPEVVIPAKPAEVIAAHEEEIIEWDCGPVLKAGSR